MSEANLVRLCKIFIYVICNPKFIVKNTSIYLKCLEWILSTTYFFVDIYLGMIFEVESGFELKLAQDIWVLKNWERKLLYILTTPHIKLFKVYWYYFLPFLVSCSRLILLFYSFRRHPHVSISVRQ